MSEVFVTLCIWCHCLINLLDRLKGLKWPLLRQGLVINKSKLFAQALGEQWHLKMKHWQTAQLLREKTKEAQHPFVSNQTTERMLLPNTLRTSQQGIHDKAIKA